MVSRSLEIIEKSEKDFWMQRQLVLLKVSSVNPSFPRDMEFGAF